jgi:hypothetical protein
MPRRTVQRTMSNGLPLPQSARYRLRAPFRGRAPIVTTLAAFVALAACSPTSTSSAGSSKSPTTSITTSSAPSPSLPAVPAPPSGFHVVGNRILDSHGSPFIARGLEVYDLSSPHWQADLRTDATVGNLSASEFAAAARFWHANVIRMQLAEDDLIRGASLDYAYLNEIDSLVALANADGMAVIISDQTEETSNTPAPTAESVTFWQDVANHFKSNRSVIFDLFNEWRVPYRDLGGEQQVWNLWEHGGVDPATGRSYVGMQQLVNAVRSTGAGNLILAQGIAAGEVLDDVNDHQLVGGNIAYAVHPYFSAQEAQDPIGLWDSRFGDVSGTVAVMADEWGEYQSSRGECFPAAPQMVPEFLSYLSSHHIGLVGWALFPGVLVRGWSWTTPTAFDQPTYTCGPAIPFPNLSPTAQGAGQDLWRYFTEEAEHSST